MNELDRFPTERLEAELADRWSRRQNAPGREECGQIIAAVGDLLGPHVGGVMMLVVPTSDAPRLLYRLAEQLASPPVHAALWTVHFRDLRTNDPVDPDLLADV